MSTLLEKAIIDASALKDAALKNAENLVIEKYSQEIKQAMDRLLQEQDPDFGALEDLGTDPATEPLSADPVLDLEAPLPEEPDASPTSDGETVDPESVVRDLPDAFSSQEEETFRINLDQLEAEFAEPDVGVFAGDDVLEDDELSIDITDLETTGVSSVETPTFEAPAPSVESPAPAAAAPGLQEIIEKALEELVLEDDTLDELVLEEDEDEEDGESEGIYTETLTVDLDPQKSGWMNRPQEDLEDQVLASEQDDENKETNQNLRDTVSKLQNENNILASAGLKLKNENEKFHAAIIALREKLEQTNVSNAKLLYINQALENASLNERQKRTIVEAISRAETVDNAKVIYETFQDTVGSATSGKKAPSSLTEAVTRRSSMLTAARHEQKQKDASPFFERMQKLAGIKD